MGSTAFSFLVIIAIVAIVVRRNKKWKELQAEVLDKLGYPDWNIVSYFDDMVVVKSRQTLEKYDAVRYFKEDKLRLDKAEFSFSLKKTVLSKLEGNNNFTDYESRATYKRLKKKIDELEENARFFRVDVEYITRAGNKLDSKKIALNEKEIEKFRKDPSLLMSKSEYNKFLKEQQKAELGQKHHAYYEKVNQIIDSANENRDILVIKGSKDNLDNLILQLFDRTVNSIKKIKSLDSDEWNIIGDFITNTKKEVNEIIDSNQKILKYYDSAEFTKVKDSCEVLMKSQREFNEYIEEKVQSVSQLFGQRITRTETSNSDVNNYIRPYKKSITPFTAEVSASVFASAENNPLEYVVKNFYPNKTDYPEQIQKLHLLVEELETLKDAKQIIDKNKIEYQQFLGDVPAYVMENDPEGFYSRLGFANVSEDALTVQYVFSYTSGGGKAHRSFTVPMTEETIIELIKLLESRLTVKAFAKEQRNLMTAKLREHIKSRDNYTCCICGNSVKKEPNLLLEIDHIVPVSKGGCTVEENLQTLCWKCNRSKSNKLLD